MPMTAYGIYALVIAPGSLPFPGAVVAFAEPPGITLMSAN
jgi:hypothetical protein